MLDRPAAPACRRTTSAPPASAALHVADDIGTLPVEHDRRARPAGSSPAARRRQRMRTDAADVARLERGPGGQFFNWYDPRDRRAADDLAGRRQPGLPVPLQRRQRLAGRGADHGPRAEPKLRRRARAIEAAMDWGFSTTRVGQLTAARGPRSPATPGQPEAARRPSTTPPPLRHAQHRAADHLLPGHRGGLDPARALLPACSGRCPHRAATSAGRRRSREGVTREYLGVDVFEGHYSYAGMDLVPTWGGSMFEALMVPLLVPEEQWGRAAGASTTRCTCARRSRRPAEAGYGYWGFSPSNDPDGGYREYGVDAIGHEHRRLHLRPGAHDVDLGVRGLPAGEAPPESYGRGVVDAARLVPRAGLRAARGAGQPRPA